jgi:predicted esterase
MGSRRTSRSPLGLIVGLVALASLGACGGGGGGASGGGSGGGAALPLPQIASFSVQPATIAQGQSATLSWSVSGASSLSIDNGVGDVTGATSRAVSPAATTTYVLTARNATGSVTASAAVTVTPPGQPYPVGLSDATIEVSGVRRDYRVHAPALAGPPKAIVLVLHGGGGAGLAIANAGAHPLSVFRTVADREGFVVVYPGGLPGGDGDPGWNDCRADNQLASTDDIAFLDALIDRLRSQYGLPASRVFLSGGSNGAQMTFAYVTARAAAVAAAAPPTAICPSTRSPGPAAKTPPDPFRSS